MSTNRTDHDEPANPDDRDAGGRHLPEVGDDERENREHIAETGEPKRDKFGNADGAS